MGALRLLHAVRGLVIPALQGAQPPRSHPCPGGHDRLFVSFKLQCVDELDKDVQALPSGVDAAVPVLER